MRDLIRVAAGIIIALIIYTTLSKISIFAVQIINVFSLVVIYFALEKGEVFGACLGALCGLIYDSFSLGVFGVAGIAKTVTGFLAGYISKKIDVTPFVRSLILIFILISAELIVWGFFYSYIFSESFNTGKGLVFFQPLGTAFSGGLIFLLVRKFRGVTSKHKK